MMLLLCLWSGLLVVMGGLLIVGGTPTDCLMYVGR
jgi:hypothetical protein